MSVFAAVMREGSFASAAKALQMTPSGVSHRISNLEERLGVRLLNRTTRTLSLTEPGEIYHARAVQIVADIEEAERDTAQLYAAPRGRLRVTSAIAFGNQELIGVLPEFLHAYPEIAVELTLTDGIVDLVAEDFDVGIRSGNLEDPSMIARRLVSTHRIVTAAPSYLAEHGTPKHPRDLERHNCLLRHGQRQPHNEWPFEAEDEKLTVKVSGSFSANTNEGIYLAALAGVGILRLASFVVEDALADGRLVPVLESYTSRDDVPIFAVYPSSRHLSPKIRTFVDFLSERLPHLD